MHGAGPVHAAETMNCHRRMSLIPEWPCFIALFVFLMRIYIYFQGNLWL